MPDITQRIADIISEHMIRTDPNHPGYRRCRHGDQPIEEDIGDTYLDDWRAHVAEVLTTELGLTQEWTWSWPNGSAMGVPGYGFSVPTRDEAVLEADSYMNVVSRYVTEWVPDVP